MVVPHVAGTRKPSSPTRASPDKEAREQMFRTAAYLLAERRGFCPERELDDWAEGRARGRARGGQPRRAAPLWQAGLDAGQYVDNHPAQ